MKTGFKLIDALEEMEKQDIDLIIATSHDNVYYSSHSDIMTIRLLKRLAAVFIPSEGDPVFGVHANEEVSARKTTWIDDLRVYEGGEWEPLKPVNFMDETVRKLGYEDKRIGVEALDLPGMCYDYLREILPNAEFVDCQGIFDSMRAVKSPEEIDHMCKINMATAKAITVAYEMAEPGDTEKEIAQNMIELCLEYGADSVAFMTMGAGRNIFETHHIPGSYRIREGDFIHVDFGCYFDGYLSDISRTAVVNKPDRDQLQAYEFAVSAERAVGEALIPGSTVMEVHEATERFYMDRGHKYKRAFVGHGLGIGCHEYPFLGPSHGDWFIEPGMFFQVEPSIVMEGTRVHTENSYLVTQSGGQNVSEYRDLTDIQVIR